MTRPGVAVVIPTRDRADLLALTLRSVLSQRGVDMDVIVVDDGKRSDTAALVSALADRRLRLVRADAIHGVSAARNVGIAHVEREWVAFCDDDDLWAPDKLASQLDVLQNGGASWAYAGDVMSDLNLRVVAGGMPPMPDDVMRDLPRHNSVPAGASNVMVRTSVLACAGAFDPSLRTSEDWDMWLRLARTAGRPACVPRPLVALRMHAGMASRNADSMLVDIEAIARRHNVAVDRARHRRWAAWMALQDHKRWTALGHYAGAVAAGDWRSAGRAIVALVDPHVTRPRGPAAADPWIAEAQRWLDELRDGLPKV